MPSKTDQRLHALTTATRLCFQRLYDADPQLLVAAPGRVNLIGEHTDYNDGFVLPVAIDRHVVLAASPRRDRYVQLYAADFDQACTFSLDDIEHDSGTRWSNYERGVAWALQEAGYELPGLDIVLSSNVPIGSGLSSSAAIEVATAFAFQLAGNLPLDGVQRALLCQKAENEFVGMRCGIMDQYIISLGKRDHALLIDCRSLDYELVPIPAGCALVVCDTQKRRGLVDSEYNTRRHECEQGAQMLGIPALRDIGAEEFRTREAELPPVIRKRCRHVVTENHRVLDAVQSLRTNELARFGELMNASHVSLRDDYQVSCVELDAMVQVAWEQQGVLGARMTGAGFGGCTVNLVQEQDADRFQQKVASGYTAITDLEPEIYVCKAEEGVRRLD